MDPHHLKPASTAVPVQGFCSGPKPASVAPGDRPTFTFIDHDDDLTSKRIRDANARKAIRSHVMRDVRRRERLAGLKRVPRRENRQKPEPTVISTHFKTDADPSKDNLEQETTSLCSLSSSSRVAEPIGNALNGEQRLRRPSTFMAGHSPSSRFSPSPWLFPISWLLDPFNTLPGASQAPSMIGHLISYYKSVFVPMTFPNEQKSSQQERALMVKSAFTSPGAFFGLMSMCAAHRAILNGCHSDLMDSSTNCHRVLHEPDYYIMKANCIRAVNKKMCDPAVALSDETVDTIINLLTSTLVVGLFDEARIHLTGLKRMVELRGGITDDSIRCSSVLAGILVADVKCASGLMVKPVFPLTWDSQPEPSGMQQRVRLLGSPALNRLGSALFASSCVSPPLVEILYLIRDIILFNQANKEKPTILSPEDHHFFRLLNCEAEHQLLSYIYTRSNGGSTSSSSVMDLHPIEAVTRVACICFLNHFMIVSPPSSGLGRALTKHLKNAVAECTLPLLSHLPRENYGLLAWTLFIGAQGSAKQIERPWFVERLSGIAMVCDWRHWEQMSDILADYFYVPRIHDAQWKPIWDEAMNGLGMEGKWTSF